MSMIVFRMVGQTLWQNRNPREQANDTSNLDHSVIRWVRFLYNIRFEISSSVPARNPNMLMCLIVCNAYLFLPCWKRNIIKRYTFTCHYVCFCSAHQKGFHIRCCILIVESCIALRVLLCRTSRRSSSTAASCSQTWTRRGA